MNYCIIVYWIIVYFNVYQWIYILIFQCFKIWSSYEKLHNEIFSGTDILIILLIFVLKFFLINSILPQKNYQTVKKKQLLIILPFLGHLSFETRNRIKSCIRNQLPFCSLRIAFQSKTRPSNLFRFKESVPKYLCLHLIYKFPCSCCNLPYYCENERHLFVRASEHLGITPLTQKKVKNPKKCSIMDDILLEGHNATYNDFSILIS